MSRANKLLAKTKRLEAKVRKNFNKLQAHKDVTDVELKQVDFVLEREVDKFLEQNTELMDAVAEIEELEKVEAVEAPPEPPVEIKKKSKKQRKKEKRLQQKVIEPVVELVPEVEAFTTKAKSVQRIDYSYPDEKDFGIELQLPAGIITASEIRSGDEVVFGSGILEGRSLEIIDVINANTLRLDDVSNYSEQESNIPIRFTIN